MFSSMIEIRNLSVSVDGKRILNDVNLHIDQGETIVLFGPNGSGKTSLLKTIMGIPQYRVESGSIVFRGEDITKRSIDERARLGIGIVFQNPPAVRGVRLKDLLRICMEKSASYKQERINEDADKLNFTEFLDETSIWGFPAERSNGPNSFNFSPRIPSSLCSMNLIRVWTWSISIWWAR